MLRLSAPQGNAVSMKVELVVSWRRHQGQFGTLFKVPAPNLLVKALTKSLRNTDGTLNSLRIDLDSITFLNYQTILRVRYCVHVGLRVAKFQRDFVLASAEHII